MSDIDTATFAREIRDAYAARSTNVTPPTARDATFDLPRAYAVEAALAELRAADGHRPVGRKVGFANKAAWRVLKLETLVWANMYDDTVRVATGDAASLDVSRMASPKIEPEIVFKMKTVPPSDLDAAAILAHVDWLAIGFEIIDSVYQDWKFQPADFVASLGLHAALVVGTPVPVTPDAIPALVDALPTFKVRLHKDGALVAEGSGRNSLKSPALALAELATALHKQTGVRALGAGELVSSGTLTESQPIRGGETWRVDVEGLDLPSLSLAT